MVLINQSDSTTFVKDRDAISLPLYHQSGFFLSTLSPRPSVSLLLRFDLPPVYPGTVRMTCLHRIKLQPPSSASA